ncbi:hypothetical protein AB6A40_006632 [Gnathostoma spinigerum]|uniref:Uncharacterized protein n=1 Tax=Gnathostoma spinigerum TaxID=75299 RepID=A0ABD6EJ50_9BILA
MFCVNPALVDPNCSTKNEKVEIKELLNAEKKNAKMIKCRRCQSLIFEKNKVGILEGEPKELREMSVGGEKGKFFEKISLWWYTDNEFIFDTVGWQTVDNQKCLMCGDCEFGPFGWRTDDDKKFYISCERVKYM